jgi:hypothetical protein
VADDDFDIVEWIGLLLTQDNRRRLKSMVKARAEMKEPFYFPSGSGKTAKFGLSTAFDPRFQQVFPWKTDRSIEPSLDAIHKALARRGAPRTCRVISPGYEYGETVPLDQALESALDDNWDQNVVVMCLPGRLLYWHDQYSQHAIVYRRAGAYTGAPSATRQTRD